MTRRPLPNPTELATLALLDRAAKARENFTDFFEFVIRHETDGYALKATPHQRLMFSFDEHHPLCVIIIPVGCSKSVYVGAKCLYKLGRNPTNRGVLFSAAQDQSMKVLKMVSNYIEDEKLNASLRLVFPELRRSNRPGDKWTTDKIDIQRPAGIKDPSLQAIGIDGTIQGSRIAFALPDDLVVDKNSYTKSERDKLEIEFYDRIMSRLDPKYSECTVCNTPWDRDDLLFRLEKQGWPTLVMDIYGFVRISNAKAEWMNMALQTMIRPSETRIGDEHDWYRLTAFDPDPEEKHVLFEERYPSDVIEEIKTHRLTPNAFARSCLVTPLSDDSLRCQPEWIERCKLRGIGKSFVSNYIGSNPTITGVDLAIGQGKGHDKSTFFTVELRPDGTKNILDIQSGRFTGPDIVDIIIDKIDKYKSVGWVENNGAQEYILQFARKKRKDIKVNSHTTGGANKRDKDFGVESVFADLKDGAWIIPCDTDGKCNKETQAFINECLFYQPPPAHTGDHLMAAWIAREGCRKKRGGKHQAKTGKPREITHNNTGGF